MLRYAILFYPPSLSLLFINAQSLSLGKFRVLTKHPKVKEVEATDTFTFDKDFKAPLVRLKINNIQLKETPEENSATTEVSERERER